MYLFNKLVMNDILFELTDFVFEAKLRDRLIRIVISQIFLQFEEKNPCRYLVHYSAIASVISAEPPLTNSSPRSSPITAPSPQATF